MRTTKTRLKKNQAEYVKSLTKEKHEAINPETKEKVSVDFSKDLYSLVDTLSPHKTLKNTFEIDKEVADGYIKYRLTDYNKVVEHYSAIRKFLKEFSHTRLYQHLQSLNNPEKALEILLDMFCPPPKKEKGNQGQGNKQGSQENQEGDNDNNSNQDNQENKQENSRGNSQEGDNSNENDSSKSNENNKDNQENSEEQKQEEGQGENQEQEQDENESNANNQKQKGGGSSKQEQENNSSNQESSADNKKPNKNQSDELDDSKEDELSDNPPPPLMDLEKFKDSMPAIEQALKNNVLDDDLMRKIVGKSAGTDHNELKTIEGLADNIEKVSNFFQGAPYTILDVARKFGVTEQYTREEEVSDVDYPEKDWRITNIKTFSDIPKILPYQFLYPNDIFDKMLIDKDLNIKQYQSRRKKKQILYILIDGSGSMNTQRQITACGIAIAYVRKAIEEGSYYFFRFFDTSVFELHKVTNEEEAVNAISFLMNNPRSGGGTSTSHAIREAIKDINNPKLFKQDTKDKSEDLYDRADILVITDGEDSISITKKELEEQRIKVHSFLLDQDNSQLKEISTTYQRFTRTDMSNLIN